MAVFNGTDLLIKTGTSGSEVTIGHTTSCSISLTQDLPDATTKDSSGWSEVIAGVKGGSISFDGLVDYSDSNNAVDLIADLVAGTAVSFVFGTAVSGETIYSGSGYIDSIEITADAESPVSYSGSITITGSVTTGSNA